MTSGNEQNHHLRSAQSIKAPGSAAWQLAQVVFYQNCAVLPGAAENRAG